MLYADPHDMVCIYVTDYCNNKCLFCSMDSPDQSYEQISRESINSILAKNQDQGYLGIALYGGEPTIRSDFFDILKDIKKYNYQFILLETNGKKLSDRVFAQKTIELGVDLFIISIHGKDRGTQDYLSQTDGSFEEVIKGIENVKELGGFVRTNTVVNKWNYQQLPEMQDMFIELKVDHTNIAALRTIGMAKRNFELLSPHYTEISPYLKATVAKCLNSGIRFTFDVIPLCIMKGYENYKLEWNNYKMYFRNIVIDNFAQFTDRSLKTKGRPCTSCSYADKCGGVFREYIAAFGWEEFGY